jgi:HlyD family type I secretion membrane fusion protein
MVAGAMVLVIAFGGLAAWSAAAPLSSAAIAAGSIVVDSNRKTVQHLEGGIVKSILVRDGDHVSEGQLLLELDDRQLSSDLATITPLLWINSARLARLNAERQGSEDIVFPSDLERAADSAARSIIVDQRMVFTKRRAALKSKLDALMNQRDQAEATIWGLQRRLGGQQERVRLTEEERRGIASLAAKGNAPRQRLLELDRALAELRSEEADLEARLAETRKRAEYYTLDAKRLADTFAETVEAELEVTNKERYELLERLQKIKEQLERTKIVAPVAGTVVNRSVHTIGGVVAPGAPLLEVVPRTDTLVIEAHVRPLDIEGLKPGMPVEVRFPGLKSQLLPRLSGKLVTLSADRLVDSVGTSYFAARVRVADDALRNLGEQNLRPGVPVEVMIVKRSQTLVEYLMSPLLDVFARAMRE